MEPRPNGNRSGIKAIAITFVIIQRHSQATVKNPSYQGLQALTCYQYHKLSILDFLVSHPPHRILATPLRTGLPGLLSVRKRDALCGRYGAADIDVWPISSFSVVIRRNNCDWLNSKKYYELGHDFRQVRSRRRHDATQLLRPCCLEPSLSFNRIDTVSCSVLLPVCKDRTVGNCSLDLVPAISLLWFACNTWRYINLFWLTDWLKNLFRLVVILTNCRQLNSHLQRRRDDAV